MHITVSQLQYLSHKHKSKDDAKLEVFTLVFIYIHTLCIRANIHFSVMTSVCRGPFALGIYSTHGTPSFMHPLWLQRRNSDCIPPLSYAYLHCLFALSKGVCAYKQRKPLYMSRAMRFPTMWYVRQSKAQTSLRIRAV